MGFMATHAVGHSLERFSQLYNVSVFILAANGSVLFPVTHTQESEIVLFTKSTFSKGKTVALKNRNYYYAADLHNSNQFVGNLIVCGQDRRILPQACESIRIYLEGLFSIGESTGALNPFPSEISMHSALINFLLSEQINKAEILALMNKMDLDSDRFWAVICIDLEFKVNEYFNINLNLGYLPQIDRARNDILRAVQNSKYLSTQDICAYYQKNQLVIIKSFIRSNDTVRIYFAMDKICKDLCQLTDGLYLLNTKISYGNVYDSIINTRESYLEATELLEIGKKECPNLNFYNAETLLVAGICKSISSQIINKFFIPIQQKLLDFENFRANEVIECCESFVDNCMNISQTSKDLGIHRNTVNNRLLRFQQITGLDPVHRFPDALLVKLFAVYLRQNENSTFLKGFTEVKPE